MKCPSCGYKLYKEKVCPNCNENVALRIKTYNISARLYNTGLEQAKSKDLSGAIESLKKSIAFDKTNISARNLLGVVYYETGRMADALVQWVVSANVQTEKNPAIDYMNKYEKNVRDSEKMEDTVKLYNEALDYVKQRNDDMAIIRLKKALDINPKFIEALNLLALCYLMRGKNSDALDIVNRVLRQDVNNPIALGFFRHLCPDKTRPDPRLNKTDMRSSAYYNPAVSNRNIKADNRPWMLPLTFVVGCLCTGLVMGVLIIPGAMDAKQQKIDEISSSYDSLKKDFDELTTKSNEATAALTKENDELKGRLDSLDQQELQDRIRAVDNAGQLYDDGNVEDAATTILNIDTAGFDTTVVEKYNQLKAKVLPAAAEKFYNTGRTQYRNGNTEEAKVSLNQAITCALDNDEIKYSALHQLGKIAFDQDDIVTAKEYFTQVSQNHPVQSIRRDADNYLKRIEG